MLVGFFLPALCEVMPLHGNASVKLSSSVGRRCCIAIYASTLAASQDDFFVFLTNNVPQSVVRFGNFS